MGIHKYTGDTKYPCPICAKENPAHETFRCRRCGKQYLCIEHLNPVEKVCDKCVTVKPKGKGDAEGMVPVHGGDFIMGDEEGEENARPAHKVKIPAFRIDRYPVTNEQYKQHNPDHVIPEGKEDDPVTGLTWYEARDYAVWAGKRVPTEEEWEKAARGTDGRPYPWGKTDPADWLKGSPDVRLALKRYNISPYGARDMCGGIWEWTSLTFEAYPDGDLSQPGYSEGAKAIRGGNVGMNPSKTYDRNYAQPDERRDDITFRCVTDPPKEKTLITYAGFDIKKIKDEDEEELSKAPPTPIREPLKPKSPYTAQVEPVKPKPSISPPRPVPPERPIAQKEKATPTRSSYELDSDKKLSPVTIIGIVIVIIVAIIIFVYLMKNATKGATSTGKAMSQSGSIALVNHHEIKSDTDFDLEMAGLFDIHENIKIIE